jgi:hypothetical protein
MIPPCPVSVGALVRAPGGYLGRVVEVHPLTRQVTVKLGEDVERLGWGEVAPALTVRRWPPREYRARPPLRPYPSRLVSDN